jgi:PAS domain S-box-containing protein
MSKQNPIKRKALPKIFLFLAIVVLGAIYVRFTWIRFETQQSENVLQIARSIVATLPKEELKMLEAKPGDINNPAYQIVKSALKAIIRVNPEARFAYIYTEQNGKIYFIADSEPVESKDYSPPGQEYTEAKSPDKQPFRDGKELITVPVSDRWGTWISVFIPVKDEVTGKTIAVFGLDFSAKSWNNLLIFEVFESTVLIILLLFTFLFILNIIAKNKSLRTEMTERKRAQEAVQSSDEKYRRLFFNSPQPMWIYDPDTFFFLEVNQAATERYGYTREEFSLMTLKDILPAEDIPALLKDIELTSQTYNPVGEWKHLKKNGELMIVEITSNTVTLMAGTHSMF